MSDHIERMISGYVERSQMAGYGHLKVGVECDTIDIGAKIVTGMHNVGAIGWVPAPPATVTDMAGTNQCRTSGKVVGILPAFNVAAGIGRSK